MKELAGSASAPVESTADACFELVAAVERYPTWYPEVIRSAEVLERHSDGRPSRVQTEVHVGAGPLGREFDLTIAVTFQPGREVRLRRIPHHAADPELFEVKWRVHQGPPARLDLALEARLEVPRLVPLGSLGERVAQGFVDAASRELDGSSPKASASSS